MDTASQSNGHCLIAGAIVALLVIAFAGWVATPVSAQGPDPTPTSTPPPNPITQIFQYVIQFPTDSLRDALTQAIQAILTQSIAPLEQVFSASLARWVTASPGIITPGGGIANGVDVMTPAWNLTSRIAILLWPLTLAITAAIAAKNVVAAETWGIGDLKQALGTWLIAVIASASSLYWMDLANRFTNATTSAILNLSFTGAAGFDPNLLTTILLGSAVTVLAITGLGLIIAIIVLIMGISILAALIFQFLARFAVLYVLVALAPIVIVLGILPPLRWFTYTWLRGFVLVEVIGPINALLLKLVMVLGLRGLSNDPVAAFVDFMAAAGVLSALLTVDYTIIKFVFGTITEVAQRAVGTVASVATIALAAVGGIATAGAVGGAGTGLAGSAGAASAGGSGGLGSLLSQPKALGAGLETAGSVLARSGGSGRGFGAAMWGVGSALRQRGNNANRPSSSQGGRGASNPPTSPQGSNGQGNPPASPHGGNPQTNPPSAPLGTLSNPASPTRPSAASTSPTQPSGASVLSSAAPSRISPNAAGSTPTASAAPLTAAQTRQDEVPAAPVSSKPSAETGAGIEPGAASTSKSPTGSPASDRLGPGGGESISELAMNGERQPAGVEAQPNLSTTDAGLPIEPEAASAIDLLDAPLAGRVHDLAGQYRGNAAQQIALSQGAVAALSALESHHSVQPQALAASWDQAMGPVSAAAQEGLPIETMAADAGYRGDVTQFLGARIEGALLAAQASTTPSSAQPASAQPLFPRAETPTVLPWHPQLAPHDFEVGQQMATMLAAPPQDAATFARIYHALRSPEGGGGWSAGSSFRQAGQEAVAAAPSERFAILEARMSAFEIQHQVPPGALRSWRLYLARRHVKKE